jgi:hypothetical protein
MMLAVRREADVAQQHDLVVAADLLEGPLQVLARIIEIACEPLLVGARDAPWRSDQGFAIGIIAGQRMSVRTASSAAAREG